MLQKNVRPAPNGRQLDRARIDLREQSAVNEVTAEYNVGDARAKLSRLFGELFDEPGRPDEALVNRTREVVTELVTRLLGIDDRLAGLETLVSELHQIAKGATPIKEWYSVREVADVLGRAEFTVREWCRLGRVHAAKRACGRGPSQEWIVSHEELIRIQNEGLLAE